MKLIDIHCHIIPGVDDGAKSKEEALELLKLQKEQGVEGIIATPHYRRRLFVPDKEAVETGFEWLEAVAREVGIELWLGNECFAEDDLWKLLKSGTCRTLGKSKYVLVEFSRYHSYNVMRQYISNLIAHGYIPILAHIERILALGKDISKVEDLMDLGAKMQVNAESILGTKGILVKRQMLKLLKKNLIQFVASDSHNVSMRKPNLGACYRYVEKKMGKDYAYEIFYENPRAIIEQCGGQYEKSTN